MNESALRVAKILIVEDDVAMVCLLTNFLNRFGFKEIESVHDGFSGCEKTRQWSPDLVLLDLGVPGMDGFAVLEELRPETSAHNGLPVIVITGDDSIKTKRRALSAGAAEVLWKPFDSHEFLMRVRNLLERRFLHLLIQEQNQQLEAKVAERTRALEQALAELKATQQQVLQQERFRAFAAMAGGVVHDFNNALMSVIGYTDLLIQDEGMLADRSTAVECLRAVNTAGRDASRVVSRLRDFYRPREESDVFQPVDPNALAEEVVQITRPKWRDQALAEGRTLRVELDLTKVHPVSGKPAELREAVTNLLFNAVEATPDGGRITLRTGEIDGRVAIEVQDSGVGMTEEVRARCLEPFFSTKGETGSGLGLAMVFGIVQRHGGQVQIESEPGKGALFRILLPPADPIALASEADAAPIERELNVLVVDDDPAARDVLARYLIADHHRVTCAHSGAEGLVRSRAGNFDLLVLDHAMPGMSGLELARAARAVKPDLPILVVTACKDLPAENGCGAPFDLLLRKPVPRDALRHAVATLFAGSARAATGESDTGCAGRPPAAAES